MTDESRAAPTKAAPPQEIADHSTETNSDPLSPAGRLSSDRCNDGLFRRRSGARVERSEVQALKMSFWKAGQVKRGEDSFHLARSSHPRADVAHNGEGPNTASINPHSFIFRVVDFSALCTLFFVCWARKLLVPSNPNFGVYSSRVEFWSRHREASYGARSRQASL